MQTYKIPAMMHSINHGERQFTKWITLLGHRWIYLVHWLYYKYNWMSLITTRFTTIIQVNMCQPALPV